LQNNTDEPVRALVISTMVYPEVAEQLDNNKILVHSAPPGTAGRLALAFPREAQVDRLAGELAGKIDCGRAASGPRTYPCGERPH
jgi:hypothetical protein